MIQRTNDKSRGTLILDLDTHRAIVYKVGSQWVIRVGDRRPGMIAPGEYCPDCFCGIKESYQTKKAAVAEAEFFLEEFRHCA